MFDTPGFLRGLFNNEAETRKLQAKVSGFARLLHVPGHRLPVFEPYSWRSGSVLNQEKLSMLEPALYSATKQWWDNGGNRQMWSRWSAKHTFRPWVHIYEPGYWQLERPISLPSQESLSLAESPLKSQRRYNLANNWAEPEDAMKRSMLWSRTSEQTPAYEAMVERTLRRMAGSRPVEQTGNTPDEVRYNRLFRPTLTYAEADMAAKSRNNPLARELMLEAGLLTPEQIDRHNFMLGINKKQFLRNKHTTRDLLEFGRADGLFFQES